MNARIVLLNLTLLFFYSCMPTKCDYTESDLIEFDNPDSLGLSFMAHKDYEQYLYAENALEKEIGETIEYGTKTGENINEFVANFDKLTGMIPGLDSERAEEGEKGDFHFYIYRTSTSEKPTKEQLTLYIGNDTIISSVIVSYSKADGGCHDAAMEILHSVTLDPAGYKAPFVPYSNRK